MIGREKVLGKNDSNNESRVEGSDGVMIEAEREKKKANDGKDQSSDV